MIKLLRWLDLHEDQWVYVILFSLMPVGLGGPWWGFLIAFAIWYPMALLGKHLG